MSNLLEDLKKKMLLELPGSDAHNEMIPYNRNQIDFYDRKQARLSAVAVILFEINNEFSILLTQRHEYEGEHSGQISFPGGKKEENDPDLEYTARRECLEEVGIDLTSATLIGTLTQVYIPVSKFLVQPFLYLLEGDIELNLNQREVLEAIQFPIQELIAESSRSIMDVRSGGGLIYGNVPCFRTGDKKIWGATALILNELRFLLNS
jgi:8-oxo-dGTP pyrophosphatase MutT (NUDIX family)